LEFSGWFDSGRDSTAILPLTKFVIMSNPKIQVTPEAMTVIINIQGMRAMIDTNYDPIKDWQSLSTHDVEALREIQNTTIPIYNERAKRHEKG